jgi:hypothetical protein
MLPESDTPPKQRAEDVSFLAFLGFDFRGILPDGDKATQRANS